MALPKIFLKSFCAALFISFLFQSPAHAADTRFKITLATGPQPVTGRVFIVISRTDSPEPRLQAGNWRSHAELISRDVAELGRGQSVTIDSLALGFPLRSVRELPAGDYYVQALMNVYTRFSRADGHVIWAHNDQWEGQQFNKSPGNLYSEVRRQPQLHHSCGAATGGHALRKAHQDPEQAAHRILGTANLPGRNRASARRL